MWAWPEAVNHPNASFSLADLKQYANHRTIALVSHASKILLWIILERIRVKTETEIVDELARKGDKRSNHESQNTDAQGTRAPTTTLYVLCGLQ